MTGNETVSYTKDITAVSRVTEEKHKKVRRASAVSDIPLSTLQTTYCYSALFHITLYSLGFEVLMAVSTKMAVFWL
jgi:hypothetical protein